MNDTSGYARFHGMTPSFEDRFKQAFEEFLGLAGEGLPEMVTSARVVWTFDEPDASPLRFELSPDPSTTLPE